MNSLAYYVSQNFNCLATRAEHKFWEGIGDLKAVVFHSHEMAEILPDYSYKYVCRHWSTCPSDAWQQNDEFVFDIKVKRIIDKMFYARYTDFLAEYEPELQAILDRVKQTKQGMTSQEIDYWYPMLVNFVDNQIEQPSLVFDNLTDFHAALRDLPEQILAGTAPKHRFFPRNKALKNMDI